VNIFCLLLSISSILSNHDIEVAFDFVIDFESGPDVGMQKASLSSGSTSANVDSYVSACKCDNLETFTCNTNPLTPDSLLYVCLTSEDSDVEIAYLR